MNQQQKRFSEILNDFSTAMLTTVGDDGIPRARPMQVSDVDDQNQLWFFTDIESGKADEIRSNETVAITLQGGGKFLSMSGKAEIVKDQTKIDELWGEVNKVWFPEGKEAPNVILLKIVPDEGEYWDTSGVTGLRYLFRAGKAYFEGRSVNTEGLDVNAKVNL